MKGFRNALTALFALVLLVGVGATPVAAAAPASEPQQYGCTYYRVVWGDTLYKVANRFRTTIYQIQRANGLRGSWLYAGQMLCIPRYAPPPPRPYYPPPPPYPGPGYPPPPPATGNWQAEYWNNLDQGGSPAWTTLTPYVNFNWGYGSPNPSVIGPDNFSARFTHTGYFVGGQWRFTVTSDDGVRVFVNGVKVLDNYDSYVGPSLTQVALVDLNTGTNTVRVDYVERGGLANVAVGFTRIGGASGVPVSSTGPWSAQFFNSMDLSGAVVSAQTLSVLNHNWGFGSPVPGVVSPDYFSARFITNRYFPYAMYRFVARADDGVRVWVDGNLIIDEWRVQSYRTFVSGDRLLSAGNHEVKVEYFDNTETAAINVYWEQR